MIGSGIDPRVHDRQYSAREQDEKFSQWKENLANVASNRFAQAILLAAGLGVAGWPTAMRQIEKIQYSSFVEGLTGVTKEKVENAQEGKPESIILKDGRIIQILNMDGPATGPVNYVIKNPNGGVTDFGWFLETTDKGAIDNNTFSVLRSFQAPLIESKASKEVIVEKTEMLYHFLTDTGLSNDYFRLPIEFFTNRRDIIKLMNRYLGISELSKEKVDAFLNDVANMDVPPFDRPYSKLIVTNPLKNYSSSVTGSDFERVMHGWKNNEIDEQQLKLAFLYALIKHAKATPDSTNTALPENIRFLVSARIQGASSLFTNESFGGLEELSSEKTPGGGEYNTNALSRAEIERFYVANATANLAQSDKEYPSSPEDVLHAIKQIRPKNKLYEMITGDIDYLSAHKLAAETNGAAKSYKNWKEQSENVMNNLINELDSYAKSSGNKPSYPGREVREKIIHALTLTPTHAFVIAKEFEIFMARNGKGIQGSAEIQGLIDKLMKPGIKKSEANIMFGKIVDLLFASGNIEVVLNGVRIVDILNRNILNNSGDITQTETAKLALINNPNDKINQETFARAGAKELSLLEELSKMDKAK